MSNIPQTMQAALRTVWNEAMESHPDMFMMGEDIAAPGDLGGVFSVTAGFLDKFGPNRVINTPISESAFLGMAIGAAMCGKRPVVEIMFCDFLGVCFDPLLSQAAKARFQSAGKRELPLIIRTTMGAGDGSGAVHSQSLHGLLASLPGLRIAVPTGPRSARVVVDAALGSSDPVIIFEHKGLYTAKDAGFYAPGSAMGQGAVIRSGKDLTIVAIGAMVKESQKAATRLIDADIDAEIIDPIWINPFDMALVIQSVSKTGRLLVVDEGSGFAGLADSISAKVTRRLWGELKAAPQVLTPLFTPVPYASSLEQHWLVDHHQIVEVARQLMQD